MTRYDDVKHRYLNDPQFRSLVDYMIATILNLDYSPSEMRDAVMMAALVVEERKLRPVVVDR